MFEFNWIIIISISVAAIFLLLNLIQLLSAYKKKKEAEQRVNELDRKIEAVKAELEKDKKEIESSLQETVKKFLEKRK